MVNFQRNNDNHLAVQIVYDHKNDFFLDDDDS